LEKTVAALDGGGVIAYPTETVYGLGCDAGNPAAVQRVIKLKGRETGKFMLVLVPSSEAAGAVAESVSPRAAVLMSRFWPGPLTLVFKARAGFSDALTAGTGRIGVRVSSDRICRSLLELYGKPLVSTSANPSGKEPARSAGQVIDYFNGRIELVLDGGERRGSAPSTVVDVSGEIPRILRPGPVGVEALQNAVGEILADASV
jgi:L-threonylcarbamoyladenylate synthase